MVFVEVLIKKRKRKEEKQNENKKSVISRSLWHYEIADAVD